MSTVPDSPAEGDPTKGARRRRRNRSAVEWLAVVVGALVVAVLLRTTLVQAFYIPSASMYPTLEIGDRVLVNRQSYRFGSVERGDIVVFRRPAGAAEPGGIQDLIKRVVATEGETIEVLDGVVHVDGEPLEESYLGDDVTTSGLARTTVPTGHVFVMGDNRGASQDSRRFGPIPIESIVGRAFVRVWPPGNLGRI